MTRANFTVGAHHGTFAIHINILFLALPKNLRINVQHVHKRAL
jgi:hypothetical protein